MCLNGWGGALHDALVAYLRAEQPDILCLQEVVHTPATSRPWLDYRDGGRDLPQRANFYRDVQAALPGYAATFCPAAQGFLWDGDVAIPSQWGLATFVRGDLPVIAQAQRFVHKDFSPDGFGDHPRSRTAHALRLFDVERRGPLTIAHMHGLRDLHGKADTPDRLAQARSFARLLSSVAKPGDPVVACGDFNVEPPSQTFTVLGELGLRDLVVASGADGTRSSYYDKPGRFADYMLVNDAVVVRDFDVVKDPEVSDHRPLVLTL